MSGAQDAIEYFLEEHVTMNSKLADLEASIRMSSEKRDKTQLLMVLQDLLAIKQEFKRHFKEEEKALFPAFESYIINEGGAFMVMEHPSLISAFNELSNMVTKGSPPGDLYSAGLALISMLKIHAERENTILRKISSSATQSLKQRVWDELESLRVSG